MRSTTANRPLRVQFVITSLPVGGAEVLLLNMLRRIDRDVLLPEVICLKEPGALGEDIAQEVPLHANLLRSKWDLRVLPRLATLMRTRKTDAVITIGAGDKMFWGRLAAKLAGVPVICSALHSTGWPDGVGRMNRWLTPITSGFISCAQGQAEFLVDFEKFPAEKVFMIPNGVDVNRFAPNTESRSWLRGELGIQDNWNVVGIVAALREEKHHSQYLRAAKEVLKLHPLTHFIIVGEGPERPSIEAEIAQLGIGKFVHLLGNRSDTDRILPGLDVFCLTSRNEAKPVSILEALACGVPAVSPDVGSVSESVIPEQTGFLTEPLDFESTANAISRLLSNPEERLKLGRQGREHVVANSSLEVMVQGYQNLITCLFHGDTEFSVEASDVEPEFDDNALDAMSKAMSIPMPPTNTIPPTDIDVPSNSL